MAADADELQRLIKQPDNRSAWFMLDVVLGQHALGMSPGFNECYSFKVPPVLGGKMDPDNIETCDIAVHYSIAGQIFRQVRDLPPGTRVDKIELTDRSTKKPWWRFW